MEITNEIKFLVSLSNIHKKMLKIRWFSLNSDFQWAIPKFQVTFLWNQSVTHKKMLKNQTIQLIKLRFSMSDTEISSNIFVQTTFKIKFSTIP